MQFFKFLTTPKNVVDFDAKDVLLLKYPKEEIINEKFIVSRECKNSREYAIFDNYAAFAKYVEKLKPAERTFHEIIFGNSLQKIKFDIDCAIDSDMPNGLLEALDDAIKATFYAQWEIQLSKDNIITTSQCKKDPNGKIIKHSYHKIIDGYFVQNNIEANYFTDICMSFLPHQFCSYIDKGVNKSTQSFRLINCTKYGESRFKTVASNILPESTVITHISECDELEERCNRENKIACIDTKYDQDDVFSAIELAKDKLMGFDIKNPIVLHDGGLLAFRRTDSSYCDICNRTHHNDNTAMLSLRAQQSYINVYFKCRKSQNAQFVGIIKMLKETSPEEIVCSKIENMKNAVLKPVEDEPTPYINNEKSHIYDSKELCGFRFAETLCIRAAMKMGKTKELRTYINTYFENARVAFISFRQTFTLNISKNFPDFKIYSKCKGEITSNRVIIQVESLHRLSMDSVFDLVILDESELILEQFNSGLLKKFSISWAKFEWLMKYSHHLIAMDAAMGDRTFNTIQRMRVDARQALYDDEKLEKAPEPISYHFNKYKNATNDTYKVHVNKMQWYSDLINDINNGKKVAIPINTLNEAKAINKLIVSRCAGKKVIIYSSETENNVKEEHFANVDYYWTQCDVLIYTPTVSAGVSYEEKHFDIVYGYFTNLSCTVEVCIQMLGRIRNVEDRVYNIYFENMQKYLPTEIRAIEEALYRSRIDLISEINDDPLVFEYDKSGNTHIYKNSYFYLWLENTRVRNLSKCHFVERFVQLVGAFGAKFSIIEKNISIKDSNEISSLSNTIKKDIKEQEKMSIVKSNELSPEDVVRIQSKFGEANETITLEEKNAYTKYKLRKIYKWEGIINKEFLQKYNKPSSQRIFTNLVRVFKYDNLSESLENIKLEESAKYSMIFTANENDQVFLEHKDVNYTYTYSSHKIAIGMLNICGYNSLTDVNFVGLDKLYKAFLNSIDSIKDVLLNDYQLFEMSIPRMENLNMSNNAITHEEKFARVTAILNYINKVVYYMYGIKIMQSQYDSNLFKLSPINMFDIIKRDPPYSKPNIYSNWSMPIMPNDIEYMPNSQLTEEEPE